MKINGIEFNENYGGFEFNKVENYEDKVKGMGYGLEYNIVGCKATVYVYDKNSIVPDDIENKIVEDEFVQSSIDIFSNYDDCKVIQKPLTIETDKLRLIGTGFSLGKGQKENISYLYITSLFGSFIKIRITFSAVNNPEFGEEIQNNFMIDLTAHLNYQIN